jgi:hypothetical protein
MHPFLNILAQNSARRISKTRQVRAEVPTFAVNNRVARNRAKSVIDRNASAVATCINPIAAPSKYLAA